MSIKAPAPPDTLNIGGRELFMSFGMLNELLAIVGDIPRVALIGVDSELRKSVLGTLLAERDENGVITTPTNFHTLRFKITEIQEIIQWVSEHLMDFFLEAIEKNLAVYQKNAPLLGLSMASGTGS